MTIETLEYIHQLLIEDKAKTDEAYIAAKALQREYEDSEVADANLVASQTALADEYFTLYRASVNALNDFESHDWR